MAITIEEIKKVANLARIKLTSAEEKRHADTITVVFDYMKILNEVNTEGVEPTSQVTGLEDVIREDTPHSCGIKDDLINQMPKVKNNELVVPAVFEE